VIRLRMARMGTALFAGLLALTACSTVPSSSSTVPINQATPRPDDTVTIEPLSPEKGATPEQIVRGFIDAAASSVRGHPVAREHLTPDAAAAWSDEAGITVLSTTDFATVTTDAGRVAVSANVVGTVDQQGSFNIGDDESTYRREFTVQQVKGEWRIADPPDGLLLLQPDFERLYDQLNAYFIEPTGKRVVPDPRYLITGEAQPTVLVQRLLDGPSTQLSAGVRNPLDGVQLRRAVRVQNATATVDLTGVPTEPDTELSEICAQLVWTLDQVSIRTVEVLVDGEPIDVAGVPRQQTIEDWQGFDPEALPVDSIGHYIDGGAVRTVTKGDPAPGPAGNGSLKLQSAAVVADPRTNELSFMVGITGSPGRQRLLAGPYGGRLDWVLDGARLTSPTVAATRSEAWVVRDGSEIIRVPSGGAAQAVNPTTLPGLGEAKAMELSPDGVRAALVVDGPDGPSLYLGTVVRGDDGSVSLRDLRAIAPSLSQVSDVAWRYSDTLMVLAGDAASDRTVPYTVGVDGWGLTSVTTAGLPSQPTALAAAPTRQPLVSAGRTIWQFAGGTWLTLIRGQEPLPGTAPFYPL
jgi:hypothetical protein